MTIDIAEALRYLGASGSDDLRPDMAALAAELQQRVHPRWSWRVYPVAALDLPGGTARTMLADCPQAAVLAVTLGLAFDAWLHREQKRDMRRAVMLDALGSAYAESACAAAAAEIAARFPDQYLTDRFSPGYGDLPLTVQPQLLAMADAARTVGILLTDRSFMQPQKSVSAVIGIADRPQMARVRGCAHCSLNPSCTLRKAGRNCHV